MNGLQELIGVLEGNPNRVPAGSSTGGRFASGGGRGDSGKPIQRVPLGFSAFLSAQPKSSGTPSTKASRNDPKLGVSKIRLDSDIKVGKDTIGKYISQSKGIITYGNWKLADAKGKNYKRNAVPANKISGWKHIGTDRNGKDAVNVVFSD